MFSSEVGAPRPGERPWDDLLSRLLDEASGLIDTASLGLAEDDVDDAYNRVKLAYDDLTLVLSKLSAMKAGPR